MELQAPTRYSCIFHGQPGTARSPGAGGTAGTAGTGGRTDGSAGGDARSAGLDMNTTPLIFPRPVGRSGPGLARPPDPRVSQRHNRPQHRQRGRAGAAGPHHPRPPGTTSSAPARSPRRPPGCDRPAAGPGTGAGGARPTSPQTAGPGPALQLQRGADEA